MSGEDLAIFLLFYFGSVSLVLTPNFHRSAPPSFLAFMDSLFCCFFSYTSLFSVSPLTQNYICIYRIYERYFIVLLDMYLPYILKSIDLLYYYFTNLSFIYFSSYNKTHDTDLLDFIHLVYDVDLLCYL